MEKRIIRLSYRKIIDAQAQKPWEKYVFDDSYTEFLLQAQFYNQDRKYTSFGELLAQSPGAEKLHFLVSAAVTGYVKQLNGKIPDILNNAGRLFLPFKNYRFEIINSDITDKSRHQVAINFISEPLAWYDTIGNLLLISVEGASAEEGGTRLQPGESILTDTFSLQPFLNIHSLKMTGDEKETPKPTIT